MEVVINGETRDLGDGTSVGQLVSDLELVPQRVAIEVNKNLVRRADYSARVLTHGDRVEIVTFEGGG